MNRFKSSIQQVQDFSDVKINGLPRDNDNGTRKRSRKYDHAILAISFVMTLATTAGYLYNIDIAKIYSESNLDFSSRLSLPNDKDQTKSYKDTMYAHLHVAKTGGTSLLYELAHLYQNVCGNKYNSKNIVEKNLDFFKTYEGNEYQLMSIQDQCDYFSAEVVYSFWIKQNWTRPLELHIPCKDPIQLLMSNCYWPPKNNVGFDCSPTSVTPEALGRQIDNCIKERLRFNVNLYEKAPSRNITIKCFDYKKGFNEYIEYMGQHLERNPTIENLVKFKKYKKVTKRVKVRRPNSYSGRNKTAECIWNDSDLLQRVKTYLFEKYSYFPFCAECLHSSHDLFS